MKSSSEWGGHHQSVYTMQLWQLKPNYGVNTEGYGRSFWLLDKDILVKITYLPIRGSNLAPSKAIYPIQLCYLNQFME